MLCFCLEVDPKVGGVCEVCTFMCFNEYFGDGSVVPSVMLLIVYPRSVCLTDLNTGERKNIIKIKVCILESYFPASVVLVFTFGILECIQSHSHIVFRVVCEIGFYLKIVSSCLKVVLSFIICPVTDKTEIVLPGEFQYRYFRLDHCVLFDLFYFFFQCSDLFRLFGLCIVNIFLRCRFFLRHLGFKLLVLSFKFCKTLVHFHHHCFKF